MTKISDEELELFKAHLSGVKPINQGYAENKKKLSDKRKPQREIAEVKDVEFYFSDEYEPLLEEGITTRYLRRGENSHLLKRLRRGDFEPEIFLDLHGLTLNQSKAELASLLQMCRKERYGCASIMTGYGTFALKKQLPKWLVQYPHLRAMHQAHKEWGGDAALLILLDIEGKEYADGR